MTAGSQNHLVWAHFLRRTVGSLRGTPLMSPCGILFSRLSGTRDKNILFARKMRQAYIGFVQELGWFSASQRLASSL
jgi:hypothetical protein